MSDSDGVCSKQVRNGRVFGARTAPGTRGEKQTWRSNMETRLCIKPLWRLEITRATWLQSCEEGFYFCTTVTLLDSRWSNTCSCVHNDDVSKCSFLKNTVDLTKHENSFGYFEQINKDTSSRRSAWRQRNAASVYMQHMQMTLWICCCDDHFNNYFKEPKLLQ